MTGDRPKRRLVFVGGGHVHLLSLKNIGRFLDGGAEVTVIAPDRFHYYSGMGPGMVSRIYEPEQVRFNIQKMVESRGGSFVKDKVASVDAPEKELTLAGGEKVFYDLLSFNIGSYVPMDRIEGAEKGAIPVKPIENLEKARRAILEGFQRGIPKVLIVGAGPAGVELAGNIWRLACSQDGYGEITLASSRDRVLPELPQKASSLAQESLSQRGIHIRSNFRVVNLSQGRARSKYGEEVRYDVAILTIGIMPQRIFGNSGLETAADGALLVNNYLQSTSSPDVFGGGDCIAIHGSRVDRVGVYAVREAPILFNNLLARLEGKPLKAFKPQKRYLLILNLGDGSGLFVRGSWVWKGKLAFAFKSFLDRRFMSNFQVSGETG